MDEVEVTQAERKGIDKFIENTPYSLPGPLQREWLDAHTVEIETVENAWKCPYCGDWQPLPAPRDTEGDNG